MLVPPARLLPLAACFALFLWLVPQAAHAQASDSDARTLFERGSDAYGKGEYAEAMRYFEAAYELSKRPQLLYNVGAAAEHLRRDEEALRAYRSYLEALPEAPNRDEVRARIRVLEEHALEKQKAEPVVATPAEAARTAVPEEDKQAGAPPPSEKRPVYKRWWLWTAIGVALAGGATAFALTRREAGSEKPIPGDNGLVVEALVTP